MPDAATDQTGAPNAAPRRAAQRCARAGDEPRSTAGPCPLWSTGAFVVNILPLATQVKQGGAAPAGYYTLKPEVTFCVRGVVGEPCGMPRRLSLASVVRVFLPRSSVSSTEHSSHILIRCSTRRSTMRRASERISSAWGMLRWVGTSLEAVARCGASLSSDPFVPVPSPSEHGFLCSSPRLEPIVRIARNGLPRAPSPRRRHQTVG